MQHRQVLRGTLFSIIACGLLWLPFACGGGGGGGGSGGGDTKDETSTETKVEATGALVTFPDGALPAGAKAEMSEATAAAEFTALSDAPAASAAYEVKATDKDGNPIEEAITPFTIALDLTTPPALKEQDETEANLCVVAKYLDKLYVWRQGAFTVENKTKLKIDTKKFGLYMARYCGDTEMAGFTLVAGEKPTTAAPSPTPNPVVPVVICDGRATANDAGFCQEYPAASRDDATVLASLTSECANSGATLNTSGNCPATDRAGECRWTLAENFQDSLAGAYSLSFYAPDRTTADGKEKCEDIREEFWTATFKFYDETGKEAAMTEIVPDVFPLYCDFDPSSTNSCRKVWETPGGQPFASYCDQEGGTSVSSCANYQLGQCWVTATPGNPDSGIYFNFFSPPANSPDPRSSESGCEAPPYNGTWVNLN